MRLTLTEDDVYYFDEAAADRACRFFPRFCHHWEGAFAGVPFDLLDWQTESLRDLFGWKRRADGLRRFRDFYVITAKGSLALENAGFLGEGGTGRQGQQQSERIRDTVHAIPLFASPIASWART